MKYLHSMIRVNDIKKSLEFYEKLLGLKIQSKKELEDCTLYYLANKSGEPEIELTDNYEKSKEPYKNGNTFGHFAFETDNMSEFENKTKELGYSLLYGGAFTLDLKDENGEIETKKIAFLNDPDGNEIEIIEKNI